MRRFALLMVGLALLASVAAGVSGGATQAKTRWVIAVIPKSLDATAINDRGQVVGTGRFGDDVRGYLWLDGKRTDLGSLGGGWGNAHDVNERGQIVGASDVSHFGVGDRHAFLWQDGKMRDLGTLGGDYSRARAINDRGQVTGESDTRTGSSDFLWEKWTMIGLPLQVFAINDRGQIVGDARGHAVLWENGKMHDLGTLGRKRSRAVAINNRGQVIGYTFARENLEYGTVFGSRAFLWQNGRMLDLGTLGGKESEAVAINDRGQIIGTSTTETGKRHAFLWEKGKMHDLASLDRATTVAVGATDISEHGQIIGEARNGPFLWQNGRVIALPVDSLTDCVPCEINHHDQVIGDCFANGLGRGVLWTLKRG